MPSSVSSSRVLTFRPVNTPETVFQLDFDASPPVVIVDSVEEERYAILRVRLFTVSSQQVDSIRPDDPRMYETLLGAQALVSSVHLNETVLCLNFDMNNNNPPRLFGIEEGIKRMMLCRSLFTQQQTLPPLVTEEPPVPPITVANGETCPICLDAGDSSSNNNWVQTRCGHKFHTHCLRNWINFNITNNGGSSSSGRCPVCRGWIITTTTGVQV